ncbi:unnamed protein product [Sphenostylis stenocarpa]|uniref:Pectinesterase n=1 Tax=Sphenostylis stenocarpa TaxID=92480 RepID=A0AA86VZU5_9FABA|nr:unnamed protein product [Sphenostylis stenocarpa]
MGFETLQAPMDIKRWSQESRQIVRCSPTVVLRATKTLYTSKPTNSFYRSCIVSGTIDFIFGDAAVVFRNRIMVVRKPNDNQQNMKCTIKPDDKLVPVKDKIRSYLGRPWKEFSRTIVMESEIGDFIHPDGWTAWNGDFALKTLYYAEYGNTGPGATTNMRCKFTSHIGICDVNLRRVLVYAT